MKRLDVCLLLAALLAATVFIVGCPEEGLERDSGLTPPPDTKPLGDPGEEGPPEEPEPIQIELTEELIDRWVASAQDPDIVQLVRALVSHTDPSQLGRLKEGIEGLADNANLDETAKAHGFAGAREWVAVTLKVMTGYLPAVQEQSVKMLEAMGMDEEDEEYQEVMADLEAEVAKIREELGTLSEAEHEALLPKVDDITAIWEGLPVEND